MTSRLPLFSVVFAFVVSRAIAYAVGLRFNIGPLRCFFQIIDPELLRSRLLESVFYLHSQPPLFNLVLGVVLKVSTAHFHTAMHALYSTLGLTLSIALYLLLIRLGIRPWPSAVIAAAVPATPAFLLYENWLFYEYPVAVVLVLSALALYEFLERGTFWPGLAFFALLTTLVYLRTTFQISWLLLVGALLLFARRDLRRHVLTGGAVALLLVVLLLIKNAVVLGVVGTSSWSGMYIAQLVNTKVPPSERKELVERGELSRVSLADPFEAPEQYLQLVRPPRRRGVPVLDQLEKSTGCANMNNTVIVSVSRRYFRDALKLIRMRPGTYARAIVDDERDYFRPASDSDYFAGSKVARYNTAFDRVALLQAGPGKPAWTIVIALIIALAYGLRLAYRLLRRRLEPTAVVVTLAYIWLTFVYVTLTAAFAQAYEKNRIRFSVDPLVVVLLCAAGSQALSGVKLKRR